MRNRHHERRIFSEYKKTAVFDKDFNILWCDDARLFRRVAVAHDRIVDKLIKTPEGETLIHFFLYRGRYHRLQLDRLNNGCYICQIAKEITDEELKFDELFEYLDDICHYSLNVMTMTDIIEDYVKMTRYNLDDFHEYCVLQKKNTLSIQNYCQNMMKAFNNNEDCSNIPLQKYLLRTLDIIQFATRRLSKRIMIYSDIVFPVTTIDYSKFELALYNIVKIALIYSFEKDDIVIYIRRVSMKNIELEMSFKLNTELKLMNCKLEMHVIKHLFRKLNGHFEFFEENKILYAKGSFGADFSLYETDITPGRDIKFTADAEILERKETNEKYLQIYSRIPAKKNMLASEVAELTDVDDEEIRFAEMFFGDIEARR